MEVRSESVSRSSSFRKRPLEERKSLDMDVELPSKHERAPSESEMDISLSPATKQAVTTNSSTVHDEIEAHFQRSLAQAKQLHSNGGVPSTTLTSFTDGHTTTQSKLPPLLDSNHSSEKHPRVTTSPTPTTPSHPHDHDSHEILVTLNHAVTSSTHTTRHTPPLTTSLANSINTQLPVKPVPKSGRSGFTAPRSTKSKFSPPRGSPVATTLPLLTIPPGTAVDSGVKNLSGGNILSPIVTPQLMHQIMSQQSLSLLQEQQKQYQQNQMNQLSSVPNLLPISQTKAPKGLHIIDLAKTQVTSIPSTVQRSNQGLSSPKPHSSVVHAQQKDGVLGTPLVTMGTGNTGGPLRVVNSNGVPINLHNGAFNQASSTLVTATMTQPTPAVTTALLTSPSVGGGGPRVSPVVLPMIDPATSQILSGTVPGGNQIVLLSAPPTVPIVQQQPVFLVNPSDLSTLQQLPTGTNVPPAVNLVSPGFAAVPNVTGGPGYFLLSPGQNPTSFVPPLINVSPTTGTPKQKSSPPPLKTTPPPLTKTARHPRAKVPPPLDPLVRKTSLDSISPGAEDNDDDVMMTPASVEDHFAKALGEQWSKLQTNDFGHPRSVQAAQT